MIKKEEGALDFSQPAQVLAWKIRAFHPWPGTFFPWLDGLLKVHRAHPVDGDGGPLGAHRTAGGLPAVVCGQGWLVLDEVQPAGKKAMPGEVFLRGARQWLETTSMSPIP
jgi:methionyl-tRNA formyltransferase